MRAPAAAALVLAALSALLGIGYNGITTASAQYGYGYGYEYEYGNGHLIVIKHVENGFGGTAIASNFTMTISGVTVQGGSSFPGAEAPGTDKTVSAGTYNVTETGPAGYTASFSAGCSGSIVGGQTKTCTVTNTFQDPHLIVVKHVINNDNGTSTASAFTMTIAGVSAQGGNSFPGAESPGTNKVVTPGAYSVTETGPTSGYVTSFSADCTGTIAAGQTKTCTVVNNDKAPRRTPGYWKSHPERIAEVLPVSLGGYVVDTVAKAIAVIDAADCMDAVDCLAGHLLVAEFNVARGALPCIAPTIAKADSFLSGGTVTVGAVTGTGVTYTGPTASYTLSTNGRKVAVKLANALDVYNNNRPKNSCTNV